MREIGGYFEFELQYNRDFPHSDGVLLNTGRNALEYILRTLGNISKLYVPYYTCHTVMQPINLLRINYEYYHVNSKLEIVENIKLGKEEYIIYTNYYGAKSQYVDNLFIRFRYQLIVDSAQAFFYEPKTGMNIFYTPHKFLGVPSGAIAYAAKAANFNVTEIDETCDRLSHAFVRYERSASTALEQSRTIAKMSRNQPIKKMSALTERILRNIDFELIKQRRIKNVNKIHKALETTNLLKLNMYDIPLMVYPYWTDVHKLRQHLIDNKIFVATYWTNVKELLTTEDLNYQMVDSIIPIPIDQRYDSEDMERIIKTIKEVTL